MNITVSSSFFSDNYQPGRICLERVENDFKIILNLIITENLKPFTKASKKSSELSIIDVNVIQNGLNIQSIEDFERILNDLHQKEKQEFFSLLSKEFLNTLNPEY